MTIDGVNISTFGMFVVLPSALYDQPARKKVLTEQGVEAKDIQYSEKVITVELAANYPDYSSLRTGVEAFKTAVETGENTFVFTNYGISVTGHVKNGVKMINNGLLVKVKFKIAVT